MKFLSILLIEGRKEDLKKKYSTKFNEQDLDFILNISDLKDFNHKYTDFVLKNTDGDGELDTDELEKLINLIKDFDKYQSQLPKKDINQYVSLNELEKVILFIRNKKKEKELENKIDKVYEDDKFVVIKPKSEAASCKYGSNTKWCVTSKGSGHFDRYTRGRQSLYFIINKANSSNKNYSKVAVHFDDGGSIRYWDSQDSPLDNRQSDILEYAFPEMIDAIKSDYKKTSSTATDQYLKDVFNSRGNTLSVKKNYLGTESIVTVNVDGFSTINDLGPGHAEGTVTILLNSKAIDGYQIFITYHQMNENSFGASIGFMGMDESEEDLGLEGWGFDTKYLFQGTPDILSESIRKHIANNIMNKIHDNPQLQKLLFGGQKVWRPNRPSYGYTFKGPDKGVIKKLIDYLDSGEIGTKLDFLEKIGNVVSQVRDGKKFYNTRGGIPNRTKTDMRGQFSSFFASAKLAGILDYRKVGKDYFLIKGPNFEAFKKGELKAL